MKRRIVIQFIVTAQEKRKMQRAAKRRGQSLSSFIRNLTLYPHLKQLNRRGGVIA
jgi:uncharacterized protein (DUF1778 family)